LSYVLWITHRRTYVAFDAKPAYPSQNQRRTIGHFAPPLNRTLFAPCPSTKLPDFASFGLGHGCRSGCAGQSRFGGTDLIIVMQQNASQASIDRVTAEIERMGARPHLSRGQFRTVIGAVGE